MKNKRLQKISVFLLTAAVLFSALCGITDAVQSFPDARWQASAVAAVPAREDSSLPLSHALPCSSPRFCRGTNGSKPGKTSASPSPAAEKARRLVPGGMPFGVKFTTDGVLVVGFCDVETDAGKVNPAYAAGLRIGDVIRSVNGEQVADAAALTAAIETQKGQSFSLTFLRGENEYTVTLTPVYASGEGKFKTGIWIRDSGAGIGTVTFLDPASGLFAGLGHGICDGDTGQLIPLCRGSVIDVTISGIIRGLPGAPGEVKGYFNSEKLGSVFGNTECGIYGLYTSLPAGMSGEAIPVASRSEVKEGEAELLCTLDTGGIHRYRVRISAINPTADSNKCFTVTVTDPALLEKTGGIIQGMSGSPLIQNGKLIGAVTHVLINDPKIGYGIFIDNMLAGMPSPVT